MIKWTVLLLVILSHVYYGVLEIVRYRSANNPTPANVADVYDAETYQKWKQYCAEHCRLKLVGVLVSCLATLALLSTNAYAAFAALFSNGAQLFSVVLLEVAVSTLLEIPQNYIATMVIEQKYGFNRSSVKTFVFDSIRSLVLGFALTYGLAGLISVFHQATGDRMILWIAVALFAFTFVVMLLYPIFRRLGNKFVSLEEGELKDRLMQLLASHGYEVKAIEVMDASRRTTKLNAYFTGFGKMKRIVLFDTLLNAMTTDEICAVFAHELGHGLHKDVLKQQIMNFVNMFLMGFLAWLAVKEPAFHKAFGFDSVNYGFAYVLLGVGLGVLQPFTGILMNAYSRHAEYRADRQAVKEGYGSAMTAALKKLAKENFSHLAPSRVNVVMEYSHPPLSDRLSSVEKALTEEQK
ncbi:MAG: M48 family metallopeptidase [Clostridia bacterium]|nr:M48 family metallopeptidase [Clostridia bacterium]